MSLELKNINGNGGFTLVNTSNGGGFSLVVSGSNSSPSVTPSISRTPSTTPSITPTRTPSITPTLTTTPSNSIPSANQATLAFSFTNNAGAVSLALNVISGTILDNIGYYGYARGYTSSGCSAGQLSPDQFYNNTLFAPSIGTSTQVWGSISSVLSANLTLLYVNNIQITSNDQYITYNGHVYRILGFGNCGL